MQKDIIEICREKLNMMMSEIFQLDHPVDFSDGDRVTRIILKEISRGGIVSVHMTKREARRALKLIESMDPGKETNSVGIDNTPRNPFDDSPFGK